MVENANAADSGGVRVALDFADGEAAEMKFYHLQSQVDYLLAD